MTKKTRGSEKMVFTCEKNGKRSLADFENVEGALQASGGLSPLPFPDYPHQVDLFPKIPGFPEGIPGINWEQLDAIKSQVVVLR